MRMHICPFRYFSEQSVLGGRSMADGFEVDVMEVYMTFALCEDALTRAWYRARNDITMTSRIVVVWRQKTVTSLRVHRVARHQSDRRHDNVV